MNQQRPSVKELVQDTVECIEQERFYDGRKALAQPLEPSRGFCSSPYLLYHFHCDPKLYRCKLHRPVVLTCPRII